MAKRQDAKLSALSKFLKNAHPKKGALALPDGTYQGVITDVKIGATAKGKPQIDWALKVLTGDYEGKIQHKFDQLQTQENVDWVLGTLETLGYEGIPKSDKEFAAALKAQIGKNVEFSCRASGDFTNIYINELLEDVEEEDEDEDTDEEEEETEDEDTDEDADEEEEEEEEEDEEEEDEEEEEEEAPKKKAKKKGKK